MNARIFEKVLVCTDSAEYASIASKAGALIPGIRPEELSTSTSADIEWMNWLNDISTIFKQCDIYTILRTTSPFLSSTRIAKEVCLFEREIRNYDSARGIAECNEHPFKMWTLKGQYIDPLFPFQNDDLVDLHSSQKAALPKIYRQTGGIEISSKNSFDTYKNISGARIKGIVLKDLECFDINTENDWSEFSVSNELTFQESLK